MKLCKHEIGILVFLLTLLQSSLYFSIFALFLIYKLISRRGRIPACFFVVGPLVFMIAVGLVFAVNNPIYEIFKDLWYIFKILLVTTVGLIIGFASPPEPKWLRTTATYAALALLVELVFFALAIASGQPVNLLPVMVPIMIVIFYVRSKIESPPKDRVFKWLLGVLVLAVIFFGESRTTGLVALITWLGATGVFRSKAKIILSAVFLTAAVMVAVPLLPQYDPENITFLGKVQNSLTELQFVDDTSYGGDMTIITANWRGYESFRAYENWRTGSFGQRILGYGLGATIDIGFYYNLSEDYSVRYLPVLHNGYFMVLMKYGLLGVILFIGYMMSPFFLYTRNYDRHSYLAQDIGLTASVILLLTTVSITGPMNYSKLDGVTMMMGWAIGQHFQRRMAHRMDDREAVMNAVKTL